MRPTARREAYFHKEFREDLRYWVETDRGAALRVLELVEAVLRDAFQGVGKHRTVALCAGGLLVYRVSEGRIDFLQARYHY